MPQFLRSATLRSASLLLTAAIALELASSCFARRLQLTSEVLLLLGLWAIAPNLWARRALLASSVLIALTQLDRQGFLRLMGEAPLLYDQLFMLRHLAVLLMDTWSGWHVLWACGALALVALLVAALQLMLRRARRELEAVPWPRRIGTFAALAALALVCDQWATPGLHDDITRSRALYASVQAKLGASPYAAYRSLQLQRKPDVYWIFVESYGRVLFERPALRERFAPALLQTERALRAAGYSSASGFSRAPVMGGRSWLAAGSVLLGMHVPYETLFHHLVGQIDQVPSMVSFFADHGYETVLLAPSDRKRPGVEEVNYYKHQRCIRFADLNYQGARQGWGIIPDQYSLGFLASQPMAARARFVDMRLVSSHAPWDAIPPLVDDWRTLGELGALPHLPVDDSALARMQNYTDKQRRFPYEGELDASMAERYRASIEYDLRVIERFAAELPLAKDALLVLIGDHQPPFIATETQSFDTPVHVLARDPSLLREFAAHGFMPGLLLPADAPTATRHEALFSLLVRNLSQCCTSREEQPHRARPAAEDLRRDDAIMPEYQPLGAHLGG